MKIEPLIPSDNLKPLGGAAKPAKTAAVQGPDRADISSEAKASFELAAARDTALAAVNASSEVRQDRVDEIKKKIAEDPAYFDKLLEKTAEEIANSFLGVS